jgi:glycerophosphoryl diester phosphodiesterase
MRPAVLVSAHRCEDVGGAASGAAMGADYVEFDVRCLPDGRFVISHDPVRGTGDSLPSYEDLLEAVVAGGVRAHIDFKFTSPAERYADPAETDEVAAARIALRYLPAEGLLFTTGHDAGVRALRSWADREAPGILTGLSVGQRPKHLPRRARFGARMSELFPAHRVAAAGADVVVPHHWLAVLTVGPWAARHHVRMLVWTVDRPHALWFWLRPGRCWMVTSNRPGLAVSLRRARGGARPGRAKAEATRR